MTQPAEGEAAKAAGSAGAPCVRLQAPQTGTLLHCWPGWLPPVLRSLCFQTSKNEGCKGSKLKAQMNFEFSPFLGVSSGPEEELAHVEQYEMVMPRRVLEPRGKRDLSASPVSSVASQIPSLHSHLHCLSGCPAGFWSAEVRAQSWTSLARCLHWLNDTACSVHHVEVFDHNSFSGWFQVKIGADSRKDSQEGRCLVLSLEMLYSVAAPSSLALIL